MLVILNENNMNKRKYNNFKKIIISDEIDKNDVDGDTVLSMKFLLPPPYIVGRFINDGDKSEFYNDYKQYLKNDDVFPSVMVIAYSVMKGDDVALVCSNMEFELGYTSYIGKWFNKRYGIKYYKNLKDYDGEDILPKKGKDKLRSDMTKFKNEFNIGSSKKYDNKLIDIVIEYDD